MDRLVAVSFQGPGGVQRGQIGHEGRSPQPVVSQKSGRGFTVKTKPPRRTHATARKDQCGTANTRIVIDREEDDMEDLTKDLVELPTPSSAQRSQADRRKTYNHLTNFHYTSRHERKLAVPPRRKYPSHEHFQKEGFLHSCCQLVVLNSSSSDYSRFLHDADQTMEWNRVEAVVYNSMEEVVCPICLGNPLASRITICGHLFCAKCILQCFDLEKGAIKCPVCCVLIARRDMKMALWMLLSPVGVGEIASLHLMVRPKSCTMGQRYGYALANGTFTFSSFTHPAAIDRSSRLLLAQPCDILAHFVDPDKNQLQRQLEEAGKDEPGAEPFILEALQQLEVTEQRYSLMGSQKILPDNPTGGVAPGGMFDTVDYYIYYQASDGQNAFLHPIQMRCLVEQFGGACKVPPVLTGCVQSRECYTVSKNFRQRYRYLQHLPRGTEVTIYELDLSGVLSEETLRKFAPELERRQQLKEKREALELLHDQQIQQRQMGSSDFMAYEYHLSRNVDLSSVIDFPSVSSEPSMDQHPSASLPFDQSTHPPKPSPQLPSPNQANSSSSLSYANVLQHGVKISRSPSSLTPSSTAWLHPKRDEDPDDPPHRSELLLSAWMDNVQLSPGRGCSPGQANNSRRRRGGKTVLLSTSMNIRL